MIRGIYTSAMGMNVQSARLDAVSNNLANVSTPGYKKNRVLAGSFPSLIQLSAPKPGIIPGIPGQEVLGITGQGAAIKQVVTDYAQGVLRETGNPADLALKGPGFFMLTDPQNETNVYYTRNGSFHVDEKGYLVSGQGYRVMGAGGPVQLVDPDNFSVDDKGIITENGTVTGTIYIVNFADPDNLQREGGDLYLAGDQQPQQVQEPVLTQRYLEGANVDLVEETVNMTTAARAYETGQKIIQAQDGMLDLSVNKVGVLR